MPRIISKINPKAQEFADNAAHMQTQIDDLNEKISLIKQGGGEKANKRHTDRGKLLPRERINALLDAGSPFLEITTCSLGSVRRLRPQRRCDSRYR